MDLYESIHNYTVNKRADLTSELWLVGEPRTITGFVLFYFYACIFGPRFMRSRKELHIKPVMQVYNLFMVIVNAYVLEEIIATTFNSSWICEAGDFTPSERNIRHARALYIYYITKLIEFSDTFFFIARKKNDHVSFLHVYHHATMSVFLWLIVTFTPTGDVFAPVAANALIHVIMYTYYFFSALGPAYAKYLWWKKHLTKMQIGQFILLLVRECASLYMNCNPEHGFVHKFMIAYMVSFLILFSHFYLAKYLTHKNK